MSKKSGGSGNFIWGLLIGAIVVGGLVYLLVKPHSDSDKSNTDNDTVTEDITDNTNQSNVDARTLVTSTDHIRGNADATVTMVVFSDYQCPYCSKFNTTLKQVMEDYSDRVKWIHKHFPMSYHDYAESAAQAAECAGDQNKFWEYGDALFENQASITGVEYLKTLAGTLGLNTTDFNTCLDTAKYSDRISTELNLGTEIGIEGTPGGFVNNLSIAGAISADNLVGLIETALSESDK